MSETSIDISKIHIKKEKEKHVPTKSSTEILSELFGVFNAAPPTISDTLSKRSPSKKSKKSKKKKHKEKGKKKKSEKRGRSSSEESSDDEPVRKKSKKSKHKKHKRRSRTPSKDFLMCISGRSTSPDSEILTKRLLDSEQKHNERQRKVSLDMDTFSIEVRNDRIKKEKEESPKILDDFDIPMSKTDQMSEIPIPKTPDVSTIKLPEETNSKSKSGGDKSKVDNSEKNKSGSNKIQIKSLKFSSVFEANVKMAEEEARKKAEKYEDGELSDTSSSNDNKPSSGSDSEQERDLPDLREKLNGLKSPVEESSSKRSRSDKHNSDRSTSEKKSRSDKRHRSKSRSRSKSITRSYHSSRRRSTSRSRKRSRSSESRSKSRRSRSRSRNRSSRTSTKRHYDKDEDRRSHRHERRRSKEKTLEIDKKRLLEIARKNAISMLQSGSLPAVSTLGPQAQQKVISAIKSGGKSVDELTDFCKNLSRQEAMGELSSVSSDSDLDGELQEQETRAFHHPFLVKDKAPIVLNIKGGTPLPIQSFQEKTKEQSKVLRLQFPVSSGSQHRGAEGDWRPVSPPTTVSTLAKPAPVAASLPKHVPNPPLVKTQKSHQPPASTNGIPAILPVPPVDNSAILMPPPPVPGIIQPPVIPAVLPGPQVFPPDVPNIDIGSIVSQRLTAIRKLQQNPNDVSAMNKMYQVNKEMSKWAQSKQEPGQFTGSTGAQILTPKELASGYQAWAKKDQLQTAAPLSGGMGMHLLQKMGWRPGEGLGKEKNGSLTPLMLEVKLDTRGLVAKEETKQRGNRRPGNATVKTLAGKHPVSLLGEYCSKRKLGVPSYSLCFECGPDHKKNFLVKVTVDGVEYKPSVASANKKQAKADAAQLCLQKLGLLAS